MRTHAQGNLLDWVPPAPTEKFPEERVRAATISGKFCRAIRQALSDSKLSRPEIAARMSDYLGEAVSVNILNAYASEAREDHVINVARYAALIHATGDRRLLELIADLFGWTVIEKKYLRLIELAALQDSQEQLRRRTEDARRAARKEGLLR